MDRIPLSLGRSNSNERWPSLATERFQSSKAAAKKTRSRVRLLRQPYEPNHFYMVVVRHETIPDRYFKGWARGCDLITYPTYRDAYDERNRTIMAYAYTHINWE